MNFMGMGLAEIAVVMVVAFLVLGPNRTINMARTAGKILADLRRTFNEVAAAVSLEEKGQAASPVESRSGESRSGENRPGETRSGESRSGENRPGETRSGVQPQPPPEESAPVDFVLEDSAPVDPTGPADAKNGDE